MKIIPVTGSSGSGKTTLIRALIPLLARYGPVGTVKHAGRHAMDLLPGKDTTVMFGEGAAAVAGIDREKMLVTLGSTSLADALDILSGQGVATAVVEGWKTIPWPKVVIGDINAEGCILRNPEPGEVIRMRDRFPEYFTMAGILQDIRQAVGEQEGTAPTALVTYTGRISLSGKGGSLSGQGGTFSAIAGWAEGLPGVIVARVAIKQGTLLGLRDELLIAIAAERGDLAATALARTLERCREDLKDPGFALP